MITMEAKKTGISRELVIHPGETISDVLEERGITQMELAIQTGVSPAYVCNVISGKKGISARFAFALEYALGVPKSFWLNLQADYEAELWELNENQTITEEERNARRDLEEIVRYFHEKGKMPVKQTMDESILSLRRILRYSNIANLKEIVPNGVFCMDSNKMVKPYILGAWIRLCQLAGENTRITTMFDAEKMDQLIWEVKSVMLNENTNIQSDLKRIMKKYGIDFSIMKNFAGAPVNGYISLKQDGTYQMVVTLRGSWADIFWFSLFHELGHIANGDLGKSARFLDDGSDEKKEKKADLFAENHLMDSKSYRTFTEKGIYSIEEIQSFAETQYIMPYMVIGRLQKEGKIKADLFSDYKMRYRWSNEN